MIELPADPDFKLSGAEWHDAVERGLVEPAPDRIKTARLGPNVIARVWDRDLYLFDRIRIASASWYRAWLYRVGQVRAADALVAWDERQERVKRELDEALWIECFLWRSSRDKKSQSNAFSWIDVETKREIISALRPEVKSPLDEGGRLMTGVWI